MKKDNEQYPECPLYPAAGGAAMAMTDPRFYKYLLGQLKRVTKPMAYAIYGAMPHTGKVKSGKNGLDI